MNIGSASVFEGVPGQTHYVAAKAGLIGFSRSLAMELGEFGITVNLVAPGLTVTEPVRREMPRSMIESQKSVRAIERDEQPGRSGRPGLLFRFTRRGFCVGPSPCCRRRKGQELTNRMRERKVSPSIESAITSESGKAPTGGKPEDKQKAMLQKLFDWYDRHPLVGHALTFRVILEREPRTLRAYFEELAAT